MRLFNKLRNLFSTKDSHDRIPDNARLSSLIMPERRMQSNWNYAKRLLFYVVFRADMVWVRVIMAIVALVATYQLFTDEYTLDRHGYEVFKQYVGHRLYGFAYLCYFLGIIYSEVTQRQNLPFAILINLWGFLLLVSLSIGVYSVIGGLTLVTTLTFAVTFAAGMAFIRVENRDSSPSLDEPHVDMRVLEIQTAEPKFFDKK